MWGRWSSQKEGFVTIDTLWKGTTDIKSTESRTYFENIIQSAPVSSSVEMKRPLSLVPSKSKIIPEGITLSMTWLGTQSMSLSAAQYTAAGSLDCVAGFYNPKCTGVNVFSNKIDAKN
jgi:hypothetical protein